MRERIWPVAAFLAAALLTILSVVFLDDPAARFAHDAFHGSAAFVALTHIVDPVLPLSAIGFLLIGAAMLLGWQPPPAARVILVLCLASLLAIIIKDQLKYAFGRTWPETWTNGNPSWIRDHVDGFFPLHGGQGWASFPSGHMTSVTAPMAVPILILRRSWRWVFVAPILLVAIGLYGANYHYVGDMIAGVMVGTGCAAITIRLLGDPLA